MTSKEMESVLRDIYVAERGMIRMQTVEISGKMYSAKKLLDFASTMTFEGFSVTLDANGLRAEKTIEQSAKEIERMADMPVEVDDDDE